MKKNLLLIATLAMAASASAQVEFIPASLEAEGAVEAGTVVGTGEAGTLKIAYADTWKPTAIDMSDYNSIKINGQDMGVVKSGITGSSNPQGWSTSTAATAGAVLRFDAAKDGYLTIVGKLSSNKNYWVFEGLAGEGELPIAYALGMDFTAGALESTPSIYYALPKDKDGYLDLNASDIATYTGGGTGLLWPEQIVLGQESAIKKNGYGVIMFPVFAECSYLFGAQGSKISCGGVFFSTEAPAATIYGEGIAEKTFSFDGGGSSAIENIIANEAADENAPIYNVLGQRVTKEYKGILIQNGKKFVNFQ